ncbi:MAG: YaiI/YqxD family protein [Pseudomonadota bacterium]
MAVYVDADACPVRAEVERVAMRHETRVYIVSNGGIRPSAAPLVETVIVPEGPDIADQWIADRAEQGDIVVTSDMPLAARAIESGALVIRPDGEIFNERNIGAAHAMRDLMADLRAADPFRQGRNKSFGKRDKSRFLNALERCLRQVVSG